MAREEPGLFEGIEERAPAVAQTEDGLPPPAYQPVAEQPVQPRSVPGTPSPEALARLERVTGRPAGSMARHVPGEASYPQRRETSAQPSEAELMEERPRFGINTSDQPHVRRGRQ